MSTIVYRNLLIIERESPHNNFVKNMNIQFDDENKPFKYVGPNDKVIFYFETPLNNNDEIIHLTSDHNINNFQQNNWKGLIKIYSDGPQIKIHNIRFKDTNSFKLALLVFKQYLIRSIYNLVPEKDIDNIKFAVYWDNILTEEYKNIAKYVKIHSDDDKNNFKHIFTLDNIKDFVNNLELLKNTNPQPTFTFTPTPTQTSFTPTQTSFTPTQTSWFTPSTQTSLFTSTPTISSFTPNTTSSFTPTPTPTPTQTSFIPTPSTTSSFTPNTQTSFTTGFGGFGGFKSNNGFGSKTSFGDFNIGKK